MNINLLPKEHKVRFRFNFDQILVLIVTAPVVFGASFLAGYLYHEISVNEARLRQLEMKTAIYSTSYRKVQEIETVLAKVKYQRNLGRRIAADYITPLHSLEILTAVKPESVWFDRIEFNGTDGRFLLTGGAVNRQIMEKFTANMKQADDSFSEVQSKSSAARYGSSGQNYLRFRISGVLAKRSETIVQTN